MSLFSNASDVCGDSRPKTVSKYDVGVSRKANILFWYSGTFWHLASVESVWKPKLYIIIDNKYVGGK